MSNESTTPPPLVVGTKELAVILKCSERHIFDLRDNGKGMPCFFMGPRAKFEVAKVLEWLHQNHSSKQTPPSPEK